MPTNNRNNKDNTRPYKMNSKNNVTRRNNSTKRK